MPVDPFQPGSKYKGADFQEWQREQRRLKPPPTPKPAPRVWNTSAPNVRTNTFPASRTADLTSVPDTLHRTPRGNGDVSDGWGDKLAELSRSVVSHVWPLQASVEIGEALMNTGRWPRTLLAGLCGLIGAYLAAGIGGEGAALLASAAVGGAAGWVIPTVAGMLLAMAAYLTGLAIVLSLVALAVTAVILVVKLVMAAN